MNKFYLCFHPQGITIHPDFMHPLFRWSVTTNTTCSILLILVFERGSASISIYLQYELEKEIAMNVLHWYKKKLDFRLF